jgi:hypothetical protein
VGQAADDERLARQGGVEEDLNGGEEGVDVDMDDEPPVENVSLFSSKRNVLSFFFFADGLRRPGMPCRRQRAVKMGRTEGGNGSGPDSGGVIRILRNSVGVPGFCGKHAVLNTNDWDRQSLASIRKVILYKGGRPFDLPHKRKSPRVLWNL